MRISQYVYFGLFSRLMTAEQMTARLGCEPDEVVVRGSRRPDIPLPAVHRWKVVCRQQGLQVNEQIDQVMRRLQPFRAKIIDLAHDLAHNEDKSRGAALVVVRYFNDEDGEEEILSPPDAQRQKIPGQHQLLGWTLDRDIFEFLLATGAYLDIDEYG
jgi:hypothetical protein